MRGLFIGVLCAVTGLATAAPDKAEYELRARCGKDAAAVFKSEYAGGATDDPVPTFATFENHYNSRLNACMFLLTTTSFLKAKTLRSYRLIDLNEHRDIAGYVEDTNGHRITHCEVNGAACNSLADFEAQVRPYMRE